MKTVFVSILALITFSTATGASIHMQFCKGQLADCGIDQNNCKTCGKCGMDKSKKRDNGCCKYQDTFIKSITDQKASEAGFQFLQLIALALPVSFVEIPALNFLAVIKVSPVSRAPLPGSGVAVYSRNCVFLI